MQVITSDGIEALRGLFKYHAPGPNRLAMAYIGILWLPFETCRFQINVEAMELGTTGMREAIVMSLNRENSPQFEQSGNPLVCLLYTSPSPRDRQKSRMPSSA